MKRYIFTALVALSLTNGIVLAQQDHGMHNMRTMMNHASPVPSFMMVVMKHGDQLNLSEQQAAALADWRNANHHPTHKKVAEIHQLEKDMFDASMSGKSKQEIMDIADKAMELRKAVISGKTDCRDSMRAILSEEQYAKVVRLYSGS